MKITLINQFYEPDIAPTGKILHDFGRYLAKQGHCVHVVCSASSYTSPRQRFPKFEIIDGVQVHRLWTFGFDRSKTWKKFIDYFLFFIQTTLHILFLSRKADIYFSLTTPPYIGLPSNIISVLFKKKSYHWIMDLYPDALFANETLTSDSLAGRTLRFLTRKMFSLSDGILAIGPCMEEKINGYLTETKRDRPVNHTWIPLWFSTISEQTSPEAIRKYRHYFHWRDDQIILMYSGNMGSGHRFKEILSAVEAAKDWETLRWVFFGGGKRYGEIKDFARVRKLENIELYPYVSNENLVTHLSSADIHLVSLNQAWQGVIVPSKIQGIFAVGKPVLFVGARENSIAQWIEKAEAGWIIPENDIDSLLIALDELRNPAVRRTKGEAARRFYQQHFEKELNCQRICEFLKIEKITANGESEI